MSLVSVRRAAVLILREKAEMLEATQQMLYSANRTIPVPLVIRLVHYVRLPHRRVPPTRAAIMLRDMYTCQYCGDKPGQLGVMGEAGPEAIMPLTHGMGAGVGARIGGRETTLPLARLASGKLGVALPEDLGARAFATGGAFGYVPPPPAFAQGQAQPGAAVVQLQPVLVNNTSVPMTMETEETTDARGQRQQKYILSEAVGEGLATPGGRGARTMKQVYGVGRSARRRQA